MITEVNKFPSAYDEWFYIKSDLHYKHRQLIQSKAVLSPSHEELLYLDACLSENCHAALKHGINSGLIELSAIIERAVAVMDKPDMTWTSVGGKDLEHIIDTMAPSLFEAAVLYDEDATEFVDKQYTVTLDLTASFAVCAVLYYFLAIFYLLRKLRNSMHAEFAFYMLIPSDEADKSTSRSTVTKVDNT